jgi:hypothetical protein
MEQNVEQEQNGNCNKLTGLKPMVFNVSRTNLMGRSLDKVQTTQNGDEGSVLVGGATLMATCNLEKQSYF